MREPAPRISYILPLRWTEPGPIAELSAYMESIAEVADEILVVDGSPSPLFAKHAEALPGSVRHLAPHPDLSFQMGKVNGVLTGVRECSGERIVLADDDVRYDLPTLRRAVLMLGEADLVRPQNYFDELPWHVRWDTARSLLNRVFTGDPAFPVGDFPGTLAVRRRALLATGGYDGDVLFENLELMRTVRAAGGRVITPLDLYVARRPPTTAHFFSQRIRQAYDDFAIPLRMSAFLALAPLAARLVWRRRARHFISATIGSMLVAEIGRRKRGGATRFPFSGSLLAPVWLLERSICAWLAVGARLRGGVVFGPRRLVRSATPLRQLRVRLGGVLDGRGGTAGGPEADRLVGAVAEGPDL